MTFANAYVGILDLHTDGGPDHPTWPRSVQGRTGWVMLSDASPHDVATYYIGPIAGPPTRGLFVIVGDASVLETWAPEAMPAREAFRRRLEPTAGKMHRAWPVWRVDDDTGAEVRRRLPVPLAVGLPSVGAPWGTVTRLHQPALDATLAGHPLTERLEDEPDRGA